MLASPLARALASAESTMPSSSRSLADGGAEFGAVLADAAGEDDHVGPAQLDQVRPQVMPHAGGEHVQGQLRPGVAGRGRLLRCRGCRR